MVGKLKLDHNHRQHVLYRSLPAQMINNNSEKVKLMATSVFRTSLNTNSLNYCFSFHNQTGQRSRDESKEIALEQSP